VKILVISLAGIGDTLFATPLIHELRVNFPDATIDALVLWNGSKDLLESNPNLNRVHQKNLIHTGKFEAFRFLSSLRRERYDISINTHPQSRMHYRIAARIVGAPTRISHEYECSNLFDRWLVNRTIPQNYSRHSVENNLALLSHLPAKQLLPQHHYEVFLTDADRVWAADFIARRNLSRRLLLGVHVGSGGTKNLVLRRWPLENYAGLIRKFNQTRPNVTVLLFGGPEEVQDHEVLLAQTDREQVLQVEAKNLREAAALLKHCHAFLSVDTALMHLAAAVNVPRQVVIETPTWNKPIEPYGNPFVLVKNPEVAGGNLRYYRYDGRGIQGSEAELRHCMESVTVENVFDAVNKLI